jgi:hypothetical protein
MAFVGGAATLLQAITWARPFVSNLFLLVDGSLEPALTNANIILGTMFGPPFVWPWNRSTLSFTCTVGSTDSAFYILDSGINWGFIESAYLTVPATASSDAKNIYQLQPQRQIEMSFQPGRPSLVSEFLDDQANSGMIIFRVGPSCPDLAYPVMITYQKGVQLLTGVKDWMQLPDKVLHIFLYGFLALALLYDQDSRFTAINQKFVATLLGSQQGLDEITRNIFLNDWMGLLATQASLGPHTQQGHTARGAM